MIFSDTVKKIILGIIILKTVLFIFPHKVFVLLSINCHDTNKIAAEINLRLKKLKKKKRFVKCAVPKIVSPEVAACFTNDIAPYTHPPPPPLGADSSGTFDPIRCIILRPHLTLYYNNLCN
jgi:hypothetical protein